MVATKRKLQINKQQTIHTHHKHYVQLQQYKNAKKILSESVYLTINLSLDE